MTGQAIGARGKAARVRLPDTPQPPSRQDLGVPFTKTSMLDRLISRYRVWHFGYTCRHDPERIGQEFRRLLIEHRAPEQWAHMRGLMLSESAGMFPRALGAVAASRWKITDSDEVGRVFESLTEAQQERIYTALNPILPRRKI